MNIIERPQMKITYLRLENVAGIQVGQSKKVIEIDFSKSRNKIISIQGGNGTGKTVLISSLHPFSSVTSLDERSSIPYFIAGKAGSKEIHYIDRGKKIIIKHYAKPIFSKDHEPTGHNIKSYFQVDGEELNDNGNVTSFLSLVEIHFGITPEMMRLLRLGTNVNSFISLKPADRKNYIGKLIEEIDLYLRIFKKTNDDLRILKVLTATNASNLHKCHITDIILEKDKLGNIEAQISSNEREKDRIQLKINKINSLEAENNITDLLFKRKELEASLLEFGRTEKEIIEESLVNTSIDKLIKQRSDIVNKKIHIQSSINALRLNIDSSLSRIDQLNTMVKKTIANNDIGSLMSLIDDLKNSIGNTDKSIVGFMKPECTSEDIYYVISRLSSFNQIGSMMYTFGNKPILLYLRLRRENRQIDAFINEQIKRNLSVVNDGELKKLISQVFQSDSIIFPNCDTQFHECPYYRFSEMINEYRNRVDDSVYDEETIRYLRVVANNIDTILNEIDSLLRIKIPDGFKDVMYEKSILSRLDGKLQLFDLSNLQDYLSMVKSYELYRLDVSKLAQYEHELSIYKSSGIDNQLSEIKVLEESISKFKSNISSLESNLTEVEKTLEKVEHHIGILTKFNDGKKYKGMMETNLTGINKILIPLEQASSEKVELGYQLKSYLNLINSLKVEAKGLENRINEYTRLIDESEKLKDKFNKLNVISDAVSTRKGIPLIYMDTYLTKIQTLTNDLLSIIYEEDMYIGNFNVTSDTFEVPYTKNGTTIPDIRYASQSESALMTMALSFALAYNATGKYNILLLDEIDAGLDEKNRSAFLKMLHKQMEKLHSEQVFVISHNINQMVNLPMDVIKLSDIGTSGKLQNIIYDSSAA